MIMIRLDVLIISSLFREELMVAHTITEEMDRLLWRAITNVFPVSFHYLGISQRKRELVQHPAKAVLAG